MAGNPANSESHSRFLPSVDLCQPQDKKVLFIIHLFGICIDTMRSEKE